MDKIKICLANEHTLFRVSFARLLRSFDRIGEVREAVNGKDLLALVKKEIPDFAMLDLKKPAMNGTDVFGKLVSSYPEVKIIVVSMHEYDSDGDIFEMLRMGAHAVLPKDSDLGEVENAIYSLFDSGHCTNARMREAIRLNQSLANEVIHTWNKAIELSKREQTVIRLISKQYTNKQIGDELLLSENTIRNHRVRIMRKIGVKNSPGLVKFAIENGLLN